MNDLSRSKSWKIGHYADGSIKPAKRRSSAKSRKKNADKKGNQYVRVRWARSLAYGHEIMNASNHHRGMSLLKEWCGDPRPEGMTLSLVDRHSPSCYIGYDRKTKTGKRVPYLLSTDPSDYAWESIEDNARRGWV